MLLTRSTGSGEAVLHLSEEDINLSDQLDQLLNDITRQGSSWSVGLVYRDKPEALP